MSWIERWEDEVFAVVGLIMLGLAFTAGWKVEGWRLSAQVSQAKATLQSCGDQNAVLNDKLSTQNQQIAQLAAQTHAARVRATAAAKAAQPRLAELQSKIDRLRKAKPADSCASALAEWRAELK